MLNKVIHFILVYSLTPAFQVKLLHSLLCMGIRQQYMPVNKVIKYMNNELLLVGSLAQFLTLVKKKNALTPTSDTM